MMRRSGMIFVTALGIIVILTGLALVFASTMRTEALASANRRAEAQASAIELGAEQFVLAQIDAYRTDAYTITTEVQTDTIPMPSDGSEKPGYFWVLPNDLSQVTGDPVCGITDESAKLNINNTTLASDIPTLVQNLNINETYDITDVPASITNWATGGSTGDGASSTDYSSLPEPYQVKGAPLETVGELQLVGFAAEIQELLMPQLLWGDDTHRNFLLWEFANGIAGSSSPTQGSLVNNNNPGISNYLTVYSLPAGTGPLNGARMVNAFTASEPVLEALGIQQGQAETIIQDREQNSTNSGGTGATAYRWATAGLPATLSRFLSGSSTRYSADIVAVSADGRAFKRVHIVVDASQYNPLGTAGNTTTPPSVIIYRKDLTAYGWPFQPMISQEQFQKQVAQGQLPLGWLGTQLQTAATVGQNQ
jgi:hypothetical protein